MPTTQETERLIRRIRNSDALFSGDQQTADKASAVLKRACERMAPIHRARHEAVARDLLPSWLTKADYMR